ncbi:MAG: hypothetical protein WC310_01445 [Patescibacteria group bacterium]|jgi:hypothetical protein
MICKNCQKEFTIYPEDKTFYVKMDVPEPNKCPSCRAAQLKAFRNRRNLYARKCDKTGKDIISHFAPGTPFPVYEVKEWEGDGWDARTYGRDFDFSRTFFEQFKELLLVVPQPHAGVLADTVINSEYCNGVNHVKNCYLSFNASYTDDCHYCEVAYNSQSCIDCDVIHKCELCYECLDCSGLYSCFWCDNCHNCRDCYFCQECTGCSDCFGCVELKNAKHCIFNKQYSEIEYSQKIKQLFNFNIDSIEEYKKQTHDIYLQKPHRFAHVIKTENSSGDYIANTKNCRTCFDISEAENCAYMQNVVNGVKDCMDICHWGQGAELCYQGISVGQNVYHLLFCHDCFSSCNFLYYCDNCYPNTSYCFGCVGLRRGKYCILNKQYTEEDYNKLVPRIIKHMKDTGEWGEFFPLALSLFGYNESTAIEYYPKTKEEVLALGGKWRDVLPGTFGKETIQPQDLPSNIVDVDDKILEQVLKCSTTGVNYRIIKEELAFYRRFGLPLPRKSPNQRHLERLHKRSPMSLYHRQCMCESTEHGHDGKCPVEFETTYAPDRLELVYCEECYRKEIY